jgi:CO/xanthine dehydrogenase FAD-binding subunit
MVVHRPRSVDDALRLMTRFPDAVPLAGGTDFMVAWNAGEANHRAIVDLAGLETLRETRVIENGVRLGALLTHRRAQEETTVAKKLPLLRAACATVGGWQIQARGTIGGNLANASPAGDTFPPLAVCEAVVNIASAEASRSVPLLDFFTGVKKTVLRTSELILSVDVPVAKRPSRQLFRKVGTRAASAISKTVVSGLLWLDGNKRVRELRFALGSMAPTVRRARAVEELVRGERLTKAVVEQALACLDDDVAPIDDLRSTREYRLTVSKNLLRDFLTP